MDLNKIKEILINIKIDESGINEIMKFFNDTNTTSINDTKSEYLRRLDAEYNSMINTNNKTDYHNLTTNNTKWNELLKSLGTLYKHVILNYLNGIHKKDEVTKNLDEIKNIQKDLTVNTDKITQLESELKTKNAKITELDINLKEYTKLKNYHKSVLAVNQQLKDDKQKLEKVLSEYKIQQESTGKKLIALEQNLQNLQNTDETMKNKVIDTLADALKQKIDIVAGLVDQKGGGVDNIIDKYNNIVTNQILGVTFKQKYLKYKSKYVYLKQYM